MASTGDSGGCNSKRRRQAGGCPDDGDGGETTGRSGKRYGADPSPADIYGEVRGGRVPETADDGGDDGIYDFDDCDDQDSDKAQDDAAACDEDEEEQRYVVLTEDALRARQEADTAAVAEVLQIPAGFAALLLRHFKWRVARVQEDWFSDDRHVRGAVGLPADGALVPAARSSGPRVCGVCFDAYPAGGATSAGCDHYFCDGCWLGYVRAAVGDGSRCLSLRCPDPSCPAPVVRELVDEVLASGGEELAQRYARFWLRSYVEESGGRLRWCPGRGCVLAVEFEDGKAADVFCSLGHGFCWHCGEEAHRPVSCGTVRAWLAKNDSDSETANWVLANTKLCPKCRRPIEKNQGCNHMTCSAPCRHEFCWLCFDPWNDHKGCSQYDHRGQRHVVDIQGAAARNEETRRRQAKASLDRYLFHYERWAGNHKSLWKALADMEQLERSEIERMARVVDLPATELGFVTEAYRQVAYGRRVLRWAHAYGYFLDPECDAAKRGLFDDLQSQADRWLERLHGCAELERKALFDANNGEYGVAAESFRAYREKLANLTGVTRKFLRNLVKAFETDLPEVVKPVAFVPQIVNGPARGLGVGGRISATTGEVKPPAIPQMLSAPASAISNVASQRPSRRRSSSLSSSRLMNSAFLGGATSTGLPNIGATPIHVHMSNMISSGVTSTTSAIISPMTGPGQRIGKQQMLKSMGVGQSVNPMPQEGLMAGLQLGQGGNGAEQNVMSGLEPTTISSAPAVMPTPRMVQQTGGSSLGISNSSAIDVPIGQHHNAQQLPPKYVKIWQGTLSGQRQGQPVFICGLEGYIRRTVSQTFALNWPETMQIVRLISQEHMKNKQYAGMADFLVFRALSQHGFLQQLQEKKLCAVITLPSQTLLLSMSSEREDCLIGLLFAGDMVVFKPQVSTRQPPMQ